MRIRFINVGLLRRSCYHSSAKSLAKSRVSLSTEWDHNDGRNRMSKLWSPTGGVAEVADEEDATHEMLVRGGFLRQSQAGIFHLLPLGLRVQEKLEKLIDRHMTTLGASKLSLSSITSEALWRKSGRFSGGNPELYRLVGENDSKTGQLLSPTHEEEITQLVASSVKSYKQLPLRVYQISRKYRNERRPRRGLLRAREFLMKDLYTFDVSHATAMVTYEQVKQAYRNLFDELKIPYLIADASSGDMGGNLSHEFQCPGVNGEDRVAHCSSCGFAANEEVYSASTSTKDSKTCPKCNKPSLGVQKSIELGHIFHLGTRYSKPLGAIVEAPSEGNSTKQSSLVPMEMGCHGIGVSRIIAAVAERLKDNQGLHWPGAIAPYQVIIIARESLASVAVQLYQTLTSHADVVLDDRNESLGWKFKDATIMGIPIWVVCGKGWDLNVPDDVRTVEVHCRRLQHESVQVPLLELESYVRRCLEQW